MNIWSVLFISVIYFYTRTAGLVPQKIPESLKCVDPECSVPISEANPALKQYNTFNLSLRKNQKVIIYGKGSKTYYVEVDGKRGYIPKSVVMEKIVFVKDADLKYVGTPGTKAMDKIASESQVKVNVKSTPETKVEPTVDIGSLKPEMPPIMQGAFLLAGAAADDSGMTSSPKIPDAIPDAVPDTAKNAADAAKNTADAAKNTADATKNAADAAKNAADSAKNAAYASPPEDVKSSSDAPAGVNDAVEDEADPTTAGLSKDEADVLGVDAGLDDNAVTDTTGSAQNEPVESGTKVEASVDTTFESTKETTVDSSGNIAAIESSNDSTVESISTSDLTSNDTTPQLISKVDNITDYIIKDPNASEKDSVEKIPDEPKIKEAAVENGGVFGFLGLAGETKDVKKDEGEEAPKEVVDENAGDSSAEDVNLTENKGVKLPVGIVIDVGIERNIVETKLDESAKNLTEEDKKSDKIEELSKNLTEKDKKSDKIEETQTEKIVVVEKDIVETKLGESAKNLTKEDKKFDRIEETQTEKVAEFYEKVEQKDVKVDSIVSNEIGAENATEGQPAFVGGLQEGKIADDGVKSETEEKKDSERAGRVKRDFMYQPNQYAYNSYPNHQQQRNYGGRVNEYNNNNYRQYQQPNAYAYQPHANFEGNTHHPNMEANVHHQNMYHNTQLPPKVEITTARTSEPDVPVPSTQVPTNTALPPVTSEPDYEDVSVEVDDSSGEVTTAPQKEEATVSPTQETTSAETETITDKPEVEVVHEEEQPVESTESPQEQEEQSVVSPEESTESEGSWFKAITDLFASGKTDDVEVDSKSHEESPASIVPSNEEEPKLTDEKCSADDVSCELDKLEAKLSDGELLSTGPLISESDDLLGALLDSLQKTSSGPIFCLIVTACAVVGFSLGYNFIENRKREGELVAKINSLEKQNLVEKKEKIQLKDKLQHVCQTSTLNNEAEASYLSQIAALAEERNALIAEKRELEDQLVEVERELQTATESNLEMNNLLSESLSTPDGSTALLETVETLKAKLENQNKEVKELNRLLNEKSEEIDSIRKELKANQEAKKLLQEKLTVLKREKDEEFLQLKESNRDLSTQLDDLMETKSLENLKLSNELSKLQITLTETQTMLGDRNGEIDALRHVISRLKTNLKEDELNNLYDVASMTGKLTQAESERDNYKEKFLEEEGARKLLEGHVQVISQEVASLKQNYEAAEKEKIEALTKVQVLSNYFKEKETQLQKELGLKESMWLQKQSDDNTIYEQMKSLREENERYKSQLESLKKEISESETDYKSQIAKAEQKSYENWLTSRQFERKLKETQGEATQLRNMLTMIEKNATNHSTDDLKQSISESNGDPSSPPPRFLPPPPTSPPFMMFQPPPPPHPHHDYIPPPPLVYPEVAAAAARPPTLGRISSPPLDHPRFSPPPPPHHMPPPPYLFDPSPPYSPPSATGVHHHHSPSPPPPHRPLPKPHMSADQKESISPGYSEHHERPNRRSKR